MHEPVAGNAPAPNLVLRHLATRKAARDLGLSERCIDAIAGRFDARAPRTRQLADALADAILGASGRTGRPLA